jgi:TetR/AcrR family transcriptional regulator, transcriptional repressor for nem operon
MRKGQQTRRDIIRKAAPIFNQKGFAGAALSDLMEATGLEKGGIYRHFESKEQLAVEAFDYAWKTAVDARLEGTAEIANAVDRVKQMVRNFQERRAGLVPGGCPLLNTAIDTDDGNPRLRAKVRRALDAWLARLQSVLEEGKLRGEVRPEADVEQISTLIVSALEGGLMLGHLQKNGDALAGVVQHLESYLETQVRAAKPIQQESRA